MPFADVNGQRIRFEDTGGDGPPIILSHGFLMDREMFAPQVEVLHPGYRVVTWDERGFGETEFDGRPFTYWDSARDCLGLLDHLGIEQAVLGGMSQGGFLSMRAEDPERLPAYRHMQDTWLSVGPVDELTGAIANLIIGDPEIGKAWIAKWHELPPEAMMEPTNCLFDRDDITDRVGEITCPAIIFHGTADLSIEPDKAQALSDRLPGSTGVVLVEGGPHASNLTHPDQVNGPLLAFLRSL
jgi:pimeloyl-ACP methyl ester carboxylesterase